MFGPTLAGKLTRSILLGCLVFPVAVIGQQESGSPLSNASVVKLVKAGFKEKTIIAIIHSRPNRFKLGPEELIELKRGGVSENIILAMLAQDASISSGDDWDDDAFFGSAQRGNSSPEEQGTNIFGSSGGSKTQSRSRGTRGGNENEGSIAGSATVRIMRPPIEAAGAVKLERTATLNNAEVIRLVEAGFSEGTVIKRIENSPADFDLSPAKVEDLHKHRVTDPIIAAMSAAMGDPGSKPSGP